MKKQHTQKNNQSAGIKTKEIIIACICAYLAGICSLPSSGIISALPAAAVLSVAASFFCKNKAYIYSLMGIMPLLLGCLFDFGIKRASVTAVIYMASSVFAILAKRGFITAMYSKKHGNASAFAKSTAVFALSAVITVGLWLAFSGNPVSAAVYDKNNKTNAYEKYGESIMCGYTYYDAFDRAYLTEIQFDGSESGKTYYFSGSTRDDYHSYCLEKLTASAKSYFENQTTIDAGSVKCFLDVEDGQLTPFSDYKQYLEEYEYLMEITSVVTGINGFKDVYDNYSELFSLSENFKYKSITITAYDNNGKIYYGVLEYGKKPSLYAGIEMADTEKVYR